MVSFKCIPTCAEMDVPPGPCMGGHIGLSPYMASNVKNNCRNGFLDLKLCGLVVLHVTLRTCIKKLYFMTL